MTPRWWRHRAERRAQRRESILDVLSRTEWTGLELARAAGYAPGSIHPDLARLEASGRITSRWGDPVYPGGPRRRLYRLAGDA